MSDLQQRVLWCIAAFGIAAAAAAQETTIQLPPDNPVARLKTGAGDEVVRRSCALCHSTDYIVRQPHLDARRWDAEVKKMIGVYGARISDADARIIADYLARNYGTDGAEPKKSTVKPPGGEPLFFPTRDSVAHAHAVSSDPRLLMVGTSLASLRALCLRSHRRTPITSRRSCGECGTETVAGRKP